jgi:hypothetical protein
VASKRGPRFGRLIDVFDFKDAGIGLLVIDTKVDIAG